MGLLDTFVGPLRSILGAAEHEAVVHSPLEETREVEARMLEAVDALHRAAESIERHVEVIDSLAQSLPPLTESVTRLTNQLGELLSLTAPLADAEREVSRVEHFFGRHRREQPPEERPPAS